MVKIPDEISTLSALTDQSIKEPLRPYLGMSMIGHSCCRYLWYYFHWAFEEIISIRLRKLFDRGHREEEIIDASLKEVGILVTDQEIEIIGAHKHVRGHCDGIAHGVHEAPKTPHLLEKKTHNDKSFSNLVRQGVEKSKPMHFAQMQRYMLGLGLSRALYYAVNKNDDNIYLERIELDKDVAELLIEKESSIIEAECPPPKIGGPDWFECKYCSAYNVCHFGEQPAKNCRTCKFGAIRDAGEWHCINDRRNYVYPSLLTEEMQRAACNLYDFDKDMFNG